MIYCIILQAGLIRNEAKFTTHVPEETLDPLGMEHLYFRKQKFCMILILLLIFSALLILCVGLGISSLIFMIEKLIVKFAKK